MAVMTSPLGRFSFVHLRHPENEEDIKKDPTVTPVYSVNILWPKGMKELEAVHKAVEKAIKDKWKVRPSNLLLPIKDGDEKTTREGDPVDGYAGHCYATFRRYETPPLFVDGAKRQYTAEDPALGPLLYSGVTGCVSFTVRAYDNVSKGVRLALNNVQTLGTGERFDSQSNPLDDFGTWDTPAADADDLLS